MLFTNSTGTFEHVKNPCPACGGQLARKLGRVGPVFVYCPQGHCNSQAANNGASAPILELACHKLACAVESESQPAPPTPTSPNWENSFVSALC